jgi:hypothetical protein
MFVLNYVTMTTSGILHSSPPIDRVIKLMTVGGRTYKSMEKNNMVNLLLTLCIKSRVLEKPAVAQLVKTYPAFHGNR